MAERKRTSLEIAKTKASEMVLKALENGNAIWTKPWVMQAGHHGFRGKAYRGINVLLAAIAQELMGYDSTAWLTWGKFIELQKDHPEIKMKKGSKSIEVVYWMVLDKKDEDGNLILDKNGNPEKFIWPRFYRVWNADCFENLIADDFERKEVLPDTTLTTLEEKEALLLSTYKDHPPVLHDGLDRAYYSTSADRVHLPKWKDFKNEAHAYSTLCHELVHSTGADGRLRRKIRNEFGSEDYSYEELVAEIGASILSAEAGYLEETVENSAAYLAGWSQALKGNPTWFWDAFSDARKACDLILGETHGRNLAEADKEETEKEAVAV